MSSGSSDDEAEAVDVDTTEEPQPSTSAGKVRPKPQAGFKLNLKPRNNKRSPWDQRQSQRQRWTKKPRKSPSTFAGQSSNLFWFVDQIIGKKVKDEVTYYLVKWEKWPFSASSWEPAENLKRCIGKVRAFEKNEEIKKEVLPLSGGLGIKMTLKKKKYDPQGIKWAIPEDMELDEIRDMFMIKNETCFLVKLKSKEGGKKPAAEAEPKFEDGKLLGDNFAIIRNHIMRSAFQAKVIEFYQSRGTSKWRAQSDEEMLAKNESDESDEEEEDEDCSNEESGEVTEVSEVSGSGEESGSAEVTGSHGDSTDDSEEDSEDSEESSSGEKSASDSEDED